MQQLQCIAHDQHGNDHAGCNLNCTPTVDCAHEKAISTIPLMQFCIVLMSMRLPAPVDSMSTILLIHLQLF